MKAYMQVWKELQVFQVYKFIHDVQKYIPTDETGLIHNTVM
jgi:hypothetical protein